MPLTAVSCSKSNSSRSALAGGQPVLTGGFESDLATGFSHGHHRGRETVAQALGEGGSWLGHGAWRIPEGTWVQRSIVFFLPTVCVRQIFFCSCRMP